MADIRVRIAPSPTGDPHIGTAYIALFNFIFAKKNKGKFILRIEDTDRLRLIDGAEEKIFQSFRWLGLKYDEGPNIGGPYGPYRQSERLAAYKKYARILVDKGDAYYCFCSNERLIKMREEQIRAKKPPMYDGKCKNLKSSDFSKPYVIRLNVPDKGETVFNDLVREEVRFRNELIDDQVLLKSDGYPTYHLAVVVDDYLMKISHVIRAEEWLSSTPKHIILYKAFGWNLPEFAHLPLLRNPDKSKISKRKNPTSLIWYREQGYLPSALLNFLALMGFSMPDEREIFSLKDLTENFSFERIAKGGPVFNLEKLEWMNGEYIRKTQNSKLKTQIYDFLGKKYPKDLIGKTIPLIKERIKKLSDYWPLCSFFFEKPKVKEDLFEGKRDRDREYLSEASSVSERVKTWKKEEIERVLHDLIAKKGWKTGDFFMTFRIALAGSKITPPITDSAAILGQKTTLARLQKALEMVK